jgi:hypothetical protein
VARQDDEDERRWEEGGGKRGGTASVIAGHAACCLPPEASWAGVMLEEPAEAAETEVEGERSGRLWTYGFQRPGGDVVLSRMRRGNTGGSWPLRICGGNWRGLPMDFARSAWGIATANGSAEQRAALVVVGQTMRS